MSVDVGATSYVNAGDLISAASVLAAIDTLAVGLRFYTRRIQKVGFGLDDWLILPALLLVIGMAATMITSAARGGWGWPTPDDPGIVERSLQEEYAFQLCLVGAFGFLKLSVISFYRRVFVADTRAVFNYVCWVMFGIAVAWLIGIFFLLVFPCRTDFSLYWLPATQGEIHNETCLPAFPLEKSLIFSDFITDVMILFMPFPMIWRLHMTLGRKLGITGVFLLGCLSVIASIVRLALYLQIFAYYYSDTHADLDLTLARAFYWSMIEAGVGVLAACLPTLRYLLGSGAIEQAVRSVRSMVSLSSLSSRRSQQQRSIDNVSKAKREHDHTSEESRTTSDAGHGGADHGKQDDIV